jgi:hypothetical protein
MGKWLFCPISWLSCVPYRRNIRPNAREWTPGNKIVDNTKAEEERKKKEEAMKEREKEYNECMKDKVKSKRSSLRPSPLRIES